MLLTLHLMRFDARGTAGALATAMRRTGELRSAPGLLHAQPSATSDMFLPTPRRLALLCAWEGPDAAEAFEDSPVLRALTGPARHTARLRLEPIRAAGRWNGVPLTAEDAAPPAEDEPVFAFVHGRLRPRHAARFYRANLRVARDATRREGFLGGIGIHETPLRFASFSAWRSAAHARSYAYGPGVHAPVVRPYKEVPWASDWCVMRLRSPDPADLLV